MVNRKWETFTNTRNLTDYTGLKRLVPLFPYKRLTLFLTRIICSPFKSSSDLYLCVFMWNYMSLFVEGLNFYWLGHLFLSTPLHRGCVRLSLLLEFFLFSYYSISSDTTTSFSSQSSSFCRFLHEWPYRWHLGLINSTVQRPFWGKKRSEIDSSLSHL